jgi:CHAT domain
LASAVAQARELRQNHVHADALRVRAEVALLSGRPGPAAEWAHEAHAEFLSRRNPRLAALTALLALRAEYAAQDRPSDGLADRARRLAGRLRRLGLAEDARVAALVAARCLLRRTEPETARADEDPRRSSAAARLVRRYGHPRRIDRLDTRLLWRLTQTEIAATAGRPAQASRHLVAGMDALHRYRARFGCLDLQTGASAHGRDLARSGLRAALDRGSVPAIYRWSERARAQAMLLPPVRPPDDPAAAAVLEELRQSRHAMREAELAGRPAGDLRSRVERLQGMIREQSWSTPGVEHVGTSAPAPLGRVRAELGDACLVAYLPDGPGLRALVVTRSGSSVEPLGDRRVAEESLIRLRADLDTQAGRAMPRRLAEAVAAATRRDGADLAATIFDPLRRLIGDRELIVVPTGLLMTTPWALLPGCLERPVTVAPSATAWLAAVHRRRAQERTSDGTALVAGPGNRRGEEEVRAIAELRPQATVLTGAEATPAATLAALDGRSVAHVAAHGWHQSENALFSALELATGPVLGYDLQRLAMPPAMVVLSCCELGLSDVRPGDESFGMASALLAAGTATVVASVSRVADEAAMELMVRYHRDIAAGRSAAAALAAARPAELAAGFVCLGAG